MPSNYVITSFDPATGQADVQYDNPNPGGDPVTVAINLASGGGDYPTGAALNQMIAKAAPWHHFDRQTNAINANNHAVITALIGKSRPLVRPADPVV